MMKLVTCGQPYALPPPTRPPLDKSSRPWPTRFLLDSLSAPSRKLGHSFPPPPSFSLTVDSPPPSNFSLRKPTPPVFVMIAHQLMHACRTKSSSKQTLNYDVAEETVQSTQLKSPSLLLPHSPSLFLYIYTYIYIAQPLFTPNSAFFI